MKKWNWPKWFEATGLWPCVFPCWQLIDSAKRNPEACAEGAD